ncbi:hypothetical protein [Catellatospora sp. NPDC049609]|uniref:hypothetical protein n=1 Tax=Catellatospora sp. NPDC049609 TaxID=3155505 RepID=UPI00342B4C37
MGRLLYVETLIRRELDAVWAASQDPAQHQRWDARFGEIGYLPDEPGRPRRFRYATRVLPGLVISGEGVFAGERSRPDGTRTSALRFTSDHPLTLIRRGSGYWRYVPTPTGVRFLTGYDYTPGWGRLGPMADLVFRPLFGWLTAWSFDRLRLWLERGVTPRRALWHAVGEVTARLLLCVAIAIAAGSWSATGSGSGTGPGTRMGPATASVTTGLPGSLDGLPAGLLAGLLAAAVLVLVPPLPFTPAARRCLRRPPDRAAATAPTTLAHLERP